MQEQSIISGIIKNLRLLGKICFLTIFNGFDEFQLVASLEKTSNFLILKKVKINNYIKVKIQKENSENIIREIIELIENVREPIKELTLIKCYSLLINQVRNYFNERNFVEVRLPTIHPGLNKGHIFPLEFFGKKARLSSSNALYSTLLASNLGKVYSIQRCFRSEPSRTSKHLSEFDMLAVSLFCHDLDSLIELVIDFVIKIFNKMCLIEPDVIKAKKFDNVNVIHYSELNKKYRLFYRGLGKYERYIEKDAPIVVCYLPRKIANWSASPMNQIFAKSFNLLLPRVGEAAEGCIRNTNFSELKTKFRTLNLESQLNWYIYLNPLPNVQIGSFGLGVERLAMWLFGISNIRKLNCFYRDKNFSESKNYGN